MKEFLEHEIERQLDILADQNTSALIAAGADCPNVAASHVEDATAVVNYIEQLAEEHFKADG
jgi:hypothetical protein